MGRNFAIQNEHPTLRVAIDPHWGIGEVERLVDEFKPGWTVRVRILASIDQVPLTPDGKTHGYITYTKRGLFSSEMATYDVQKKEATYFYYPGGEHFQTIGGRAVEDGADQVADFSFSFKFVTFLASDSPAYLAPGAPDVSPAAADERQAHCGAPRFAGGSQAALFTWGLPNPDS